jgi:hypothetical protein
MALQMMMLVLVSAHTLVNDGAKTSELLREQQEMHGLVSEDSMKSVAEDSGSVHDIRAAVELAAETSGEGLRPLDHSEEALAENSRRAEKHEAKQQESTSTVCVFFTCLNITGNYTSSLGGRGIVTTIGTLTSSGTECNGQDTNTASYDVAGTGTAFSYSGAPTVKVSGICKDGETNDCIGLDDDKCTIKKIYWSNGHTYTCKVPETCGGTARVGELVAAQLVVIQEPRH